VPKCKECKEEVDEVHTIRVGTNKKKICEECMEELHEQGEIEDAALEAMQSMMGYSGKF
jgi:hypothetical protein